MVEHGALAPEKVETMTMERGRRESLTLRYAVIAPIHLNNLPWNLFRPGMMLVMTLSKISRIMALVEAVFTATRNASSLATPARMSFFLGLMQVSPNQMFVPLFITVSSER